MKLLPSDPDIQTIITRIRSGDLDLQPDFQRGEVWSDAKKRRLIDTILRDWHIPPIHVIERPDTRKQEVLDGQQRLAAIRDFVNGIIRVDGTIEPTEVDLVLADGCSYATLPTSLRRRFDQFTIRVFRLVDFRPDEPGELFFRLNQPTSLTAAEQRNAFFGPVRQQVREICEQFPSFGLTEKVLGFSNSRMAFDDIVGKLCLTIECGTLRQKVTAASITERYRSSGPFDNKVTTRCETALRLFGESRSLNQSVIKFNKATLFSWLCFFSRSSFSSYGAALVADLAEFMVRFESSRSSSKPDLVFSRHLLHIFTDRASLRVSDVSSVLLRDAVLAYCYSDYQLDRLGAIEGGDASQFYALAQNWSPLVHGVIPPDEDELLAVLDKIGWGIIK